MPPPKPTTSRSAKSKSKSKPAPPRDPSPAPAPPASSPGDSSTSTPQLPPQLLSRILHEFFAGSTGPNAGQTRISNSAVAAVGEYTRTFVREAIHRAAAAREEEEGRRLGGGGEGGGMGMRMFPELEVADLEKVGPQLVLDF